MKYKGAYDSGVTYDLGDVVVFTDNVPYYMMNPAPAGTTPHDVRYWNPLPQYLGQVVMMFHDMLTGLSTSAAAADSVIFDANTLVLGVDGGDDKYAITVDATGDTPDVAVALITDEDEEDGES
jgi:hypothetical protein